MADEKVATEKVKSGTPLIPLMLAMVVTVGGAVGGAMFWLTRSGRLPVQAATAPQAAAPAKTEPPKTKLIQFEPMLVNLADPGGAGYLRMVMVLRVEDPPPVKGEKPKEEKPPEKGKVVVDEDQVTVRDTALAVLSRQSSDQLLVPEGKDKLKQQLRAALAEHEPKLKVQDVLFTEFLVQR